MADKLWLLWMLLGAILLIGEMLTVGFFLLWFSVGAFLAGVIALLGLSRFWQLLVFVLVSGILFAISRKFAEKVTNSQPEGIGANRMSGKQGVVLEEINNEKNIGKVRIDRDEWRADSKNNEIIPEGTHIKVIEIKGTRLIVEPIQEKQEQKQEGE